jgi:hypothetical protein
MKISDLVRILADFNQDTIVDVGSTRLVIECDDA